MEMKPVVLLKLGGSLITDKAKPYTERGHVIMDLVRQIREALSEDPEMSLIIGNGAGSYAHYPAKVYNLTKGITEPSQLKGFCEVQDGAARLNRIVVSNLLKAGVNAIALSPSSFLTARSGRIHRFFIDPLLGLLRQKIVPVLYGDIVYDETQGATIISTETLLSSIAKRLLSRKIRVGSIVHNGITKGVLDTRSEVIPLITKKNFSSLRNVFTSVAGYDVTGGMIHKVKESLKLTDAGIKSYIINGMSQKNLLKKALLGDVDLGTRIE